MRRAKDLDSSKAEEQGLPEKYRPIDSWGAAGLFFIAKLNVIVAFLWALFLGVLWPNPTINLRNLGRGLLIVALIEIISKVIGWFV